MLMLLAALMTGGGMAWASDSCGEHVTYRLYQVDDKWNLEIDGYGEITSTSIPWTGYYLQSVKISISEEGESLTIPAGAFSNGTEIKVSLGYGEIILVDDDAAATVSFYHGYDYYATLTITDATKTVKLTLAAGTPVNVKRPGQYMAYCWYKENDYQADGRVVKNANVKVYALTSITYNGTSKQFEADLTEIEGNAVPEGIPVIFANTTSGQNLPAVIMLANSTSTTTITYLNNFIACDGNRYGDPNSSVENLLTSKTLSYDDVFLFGVVGDSFKRVLLASDDIPANGNCFLAFPKLNYKKRLSLGSGSSVRQRTIGIDLGDNTTEIFGTMQNELINDNWYSLDGRKLDKVPTAKGVYIHNGIKHVVR